MKRKIRPDFFGPHNSGGKVLFVDVFGKQFWAYGLEANRPALDAGANSALAPLDFDVDFDLVGQPRIQDGTGIGIQFQQNVRVRPDENRRHCLGC